MGIIKAQASNCGRQMYPWTNKKYLNLTVNLAKQDKRVKCERNEENIPSNW
jgi:hypothetical protein